MSYSEALEEQVKIIRWLNTDAAALFDRLEAADGQDRGALAQEAKRSLETAETYYWSPPICDVIAHTAATIPDWTLLPELLPSPAGWFYFARPLPFPSRENTSVRISAISWARHEECVFFIVWWRLDDMGKFRVCGLPMGAHPWGWRRSAEQCRQLSALDYDSPDDTGLRNGRDELNIIATCMAFLNQRILITPQQRAERHAVKRLERDGWTHEPLIRVVELRRKASQSRPSDDPKTVEWSHQWVVSGHWRQQWYASLQRHQPIWIMPFVKGPEDRPLKAPRSKVFAVVR